LTLEEWQAAIAGELRAEMAARRIQQKDLMRVLGGTDQSSVSRRMNGLVPISAPELMVVADYIGADITVFLTRAKDRFLTSAPAPPR
jgi:hypothetical protein